MQTFGYTYTIAIPSRNRPDHVVRLIQTLRSNLQVEAPIVVCDQSDDGGAALKTKLRTLSAKDVTHVVSSKRSPASARNEAARQADTEWIAFLDDDIVPGQDYFEAFLKFVSKNSWVDAVTTRIVLGGPSSDNRPQGRRRSR